MNKPIAIFERNTQEDLRVVWGEFKGQRLLNIRIFTDIPNVANRVPTRKGVTLKSEQIPVLIEALQEAMEESQGE